MLHHRRIRLRAGHRGMRQPQRRDIVSFRVRDASLLRNPADIMGAPSKLDVAPRGFAPKHRPPAHPSSGEVACPRHRDRARTANWRRADRRLEPKRERFGRGLGRCRAPGPRPQVRSRPTSSPLSSRTRYAAVRTVSAIVASRSTDKSTPVCRANSSSVRPAIVAELNSSTAESPCSPTTHACTAAGCTWQTEESSPRSRQVSSDVPEPITSTVRPAQRRVRYSVRTSSGLVATRQTRGSPPPRHARRPPRR